MANRTTNGKKLGKVQGWGIALVNGKNVELVYATFSRMDVRENKREVYPGGDYKVVRLDTVMTQYNK